jgi:hypothetical protein
MMRAVEARSRRPRFKEYNRVRDAQNFAQRLHVGVADYGGRIDIANLANHALFLACEQGFPLPQAMRVRPYTEADDKPDEIAFYQPGIGDGRGSIVHATVS